MITTCAAHVHLVGRQTSHSGSCSTRCQPHNMSSSLLFLAYAEDGTASAGTCTDPIRCQTTKTDWSWFKSFEISCVLMRWYALYVSRYVLISNDFTGGHFASPLQPTRQWLGSDGHWEVENHWKRSSVPAPRGSAAVLPWHISHQTARTWNSTSRLETPVVASWKQYAYQLGSELDPIGQVVSYFKKGWKGTASNSCRLMPTPCQRSFRRSRFMTKVCKGSTSSSAGLRSTRIAKDGCSNRWKITAAPPLTSFRWSVVVQWDHSPWFCVWLWAMGRELRGKDADYVSMLPMFPGGFCTCFLCKGKWMWQVQS